MSAKKKSTNDELSRRSVELLKRAEANAGAIVEKPVAHYEEMFPRLPAAALKLSDDLQQAGRKTGRRDLVSAGYLAHQVFKFIAALDRGGLTEQEGIARFRAAYDAMGPMHPTRQEERARKEAASCVDTLEKLCGKKAGA